MDEFEKKLSDAMRRHGQYDSERNKIMRREMSDMTGGFFDRNLKTAKAWQLGFHAFYTLVLFVAVYSAMVTQDLKLVVILVGVALMAFQGTVLMKLWYWQVHTRIKLQEDIRVLQLQIAELVQQKEVESE